MSPGCAKTSPGAPELGANLVAHLVSVYRGIKFDHW